MITVLYNVILVSESCDSSYIILLMSLSIALHFSLKLLSSVWILREKIRDYKVNALNDDKSNKNVDSCSENINAIS